MSLDTYRTDQIIITVKFIASLWLHVISSLEALVAVGNDTGGFVDTVVGPVEADEWGAGVDHTHQQAGAVAAAASLQRPGRSNPGQVVAEDEVIPERLPIR